MMPGAGDNWSDLGFAMIICSCNVITENEVRRAIDLHSPPRTAQVFVCLACSARCGRCAQTIKRLMADAIKGCPEACSRGERR
jgi:bacterioferritin-associated ferredoxin